MYYHYWSPHALEPVLCNKSLQWEALTSQLESSPHPLQLEKVWVQQRRPSTAKNKLIKLFCKKNLRFQRNFAFAAGGYEKTFQVPSLRAIFFHQWTSEVAQSCPTLCDPMDCSLPGSSIHGILQARVLEWVAIFFSNFLLHPGTFWWQHWETQETRFAHLTTV